MARATAPLAAPLSVWYQPSMLTGLAPLFTSSTASPKPGLPGSSALSEEISLISMSSQFGSRIGPLPPPVVNELTVPGVAAAESFHRPTPDAVRAQDGAAWRVVVPSAW